MIPCALKYRRKLKNYYSEEYYDFYEDTTCRFRISRDRIDGELYFTLEKWMRLNKKFVPTKEQILFKEEIFYHFLNLFASANLTNLGDSFDLYPSVRYSYRSRISNGNFEITNYLGTSVNHSWLIQYTSNDKFLSEISLPIHAAKNLYYATLLENRVISSSWSV